MSQLSPTALSTCVREVAEFVAAAGWNQAPQLFALVPTDELAAAEPALAPDLGGGELTPVAQEELADDEGLATALATLTWPDGVSGCALVQEILILPPAAEAEVDALDPEQVLTHAAAHPDRREARLLAGVLRDGSALCLLQLRPVEPAPADDDSAAAETGVELLEHPELAPNLVAALHATFAP